MTRSRQLLMGCGVGGLALQMLVPGCAELIGRTQIPAPVVIPQVKEDAPQTGRPKVEQIGNASWYGPGQNGQETASGETFDQDALTAAHPTLPMGTEAVVTNLENGKSVTVTINDRGPYAKGRKIDLSRGAARKIGMTEKGVTKVKIEAKPHLKHPKARRHSAPVTEAIPTGAEK